MSDKKIKVSVEYVGKEDFVAEVTAAKILQAIKVQALTHFELDTASADKYVLQLNGVDLADKKHLRDLTEDSEITLTLSLKEEVVKG